MLEEELPPKLRAFVAYHRAMYYPLVCLLVLLVFYFWIGLQASLSALNALSVRFREALVDDPGGIIFLSLEALALATCVCLVVVWVARARRRRNPVSSNVELVVVFLACREIARFFASSFDSEGPLFEFWRNSVTTFTSFAFFFQLTYAAFPEFGGGTEGGTGNPRRRQLVSIYYPTLACVLAFNSMPLLGVLIGPQPATIAMGALMYALVGIYAASLVVLPALKLIGARGGGRDPSGGRRGAIALGCLAASSTMLVTSILVANWVEFKHGSAPLEHPARATSIVISAFQLAAYLLLGTYYGWSFERHASRFDVETIDALESFEPEAVDPLDDDSSLDRLTG
ncbi:MAG: hypothetical protein Kow0069_15910 [Promethearchaeota archaeon]